MTTVTLTTRTGPGRRTRGALATYLLSLLLVPASMGVTQSQPANPEGDLEPAAQQEPTPGDATADKPQTTTPEPAISDTTDVAVDAAQAPAVAGTTDIAAAARPESKNPASAYGLWVLLPALVAILLAILTRQVVPALVVGIVVGAYMMFPHLPADAPLTGSNPVVGGFRLAAETYIMGAILAPKDGYSHLKIMIFTLVIGFMVGVIGRNGGTAGLVKVVAGDTRSPRRGALTAWAAGLVVFFDDYANTMIVGPTMRSVFDRLKLSRAKLAYIVDSTAAPVASLALIGTWVGAEIGFIQDGLDKLQQTGVPAFLAGSGSAGMDGMRVFIESLFFRFYPVLALVLVLFIALTRRDFGPMKKSEARALTELSKPVADSETGADTRDQARPRWWLGLVPVLGLVVGTVAVLVLTGLRSADTIAAMGRQAEWVQMPWWERAGVIIGNADSYVAIFYGAILSAVLAVLLTIGARVCRVKEAVDAGMDGMSRMFPAIVILILAWGLSAVSQHLMLGDVVTTHLRALSFPAVWTPLAVFIAAAAISFATGTSWGTMGILCPITVTIAASLAAADPSLSEAQALNLFYASVGSVLAGAIFGDHCSPISDTTVLSSIASGCRHEEHVWTQIPYALLTAVVAMGLGDVLCSVYHKPWYFGMGAGAAALFLFVLIVGRSPRPTVSPAPVETRPAPPPAIERRLHDSRPASPARDDQPSGPDDFTP